MEKVPFAKFVQAVNKAKAVIPFQGTLLSLDPGETTGWSSFQAEPTLPEKVKMLSCGQLKTWPMQNCVQELTTLLDYVNPKVVVYELYAVYEWKAEDHSWSQVPTLHVIGCLETLCIQRGIPFYSQTAQIAKNFCTDEKLEAWSLWQKGQRHARDAIRHGAYYLMFGPSTNTK